MSRSRPTRLGGMTAIIVGVRRRTLACAMVETISWLTLALITNMLLKPRGSAICFFSTSMAMLAFSGSLVMMGKSPTISLTFSTSAGVSLRMAPWRSMKWTSESMPVRPV